MSLANREERRMSKYIMLLNWTDQGIKTIKDSASRYDAAKASAKQAGITFEAVYMTFGQYDQMIVADAPSDEAIATFILKASALGNVRGTTLKAFDESQYRKITAAV
jgi:uncharacterized protein with GYD domain